MILRAIFWLGLVAVLMPHEPDLGFGRPGERLTATQSGAACPEQQVICGGALLERFQSTVARNLARVRADIAAHRTKAPYGI